MAKELTLKMDVRARNIKLVAALLWVLSRLSCALPARMVEWLGNRILRLCWYEYRMGDGPWMRGRGYLGVDMGTGDG